MYRPNLPFIVNFCYESSRFNNWHFQIENRYVNISYIQCKFHLKFLVSFLNINQ